MPKQRQKQPVHWPIPEEVIRELKARKAEKGVPVTRSLRDMAKFALDHRQFWW